MYAIRSYYDSKRNDTRTTDGKSNGETRQDAPEEAEKNDQETELDTVRNNFV